MTFFFPVYPQGFWNLPMLTFFCVCVLQRAEELKSVIAPFIYFQIKQNRTKILFGFGVVTLAPFSFAHLLFLGYLFFWFSHVNLCSLETLRSGSHSFQHKLFTSRKKRESFFEQCNCKWELDLLLWYRWLYLTKIIHIKKS